MRYHSTTRSLIQKLSGAMIDRIAIGQEAEAEAEYFLRQRGLKTIQRNFHCRVGEIDLVMRDGDYLVFTEVRFRRAGQHGSGAESITYSKRRKLVLTAEYYLSSKKVSSHQPCRFDVVSIGQSDKAGAPKYNIDWIQNAFEADE